MKEPGPPQGPGSRRSSFFPSCRSAWMLSTSPATVISMSLSGSRAGLPGGAGRRSRRPAGGQEREFWNASTAVGRVGKSRSGPIA